MKLLEIVDDGYHGQGFVKRIFNRGHKSVTTGRKIENVEDRAIK